MNFTARGKCGCVKSVETQSCLICKRSSKREFRGKCQIHARTMIRELIVSPIVMHQSIPAVPIPPPPGNRGTFVHVVSPRCGAFAILSQPRGLGISIPRGDLWAFDTRVFEIEISFFYREGRGLCQRLACPSGTRKTCRCF